MRDIILSFIADHPGLTRERLLELIADPATEHAVSMEILSLFEEQIIMTMGEGKIYVVDL